MRRSSRPGLVAFVSVLALHAYACGSDEPPADAPPEETRGADAAAPSDGEDGAAPTPTDASDAADSGFDSAPATDASLDAGADADAAVVAPPSVRLVGRADRSDPAGATFAWPGGRIIARFQGTEVKVTLNETSLFRGPDRWDVLVDGVLASTLVPSPGVGTYTLAAGLPAGVHTVELYKRTEAAVGTTQFRGFELPGGTLLAPPPAPARRIEFLGDSTTVGYGNECAAPTEAFSGATQNERLAFAGLVAHDLGADHHDTGISGRGVLLNYDRSDSVVFDQYFPRTLPASPAAIWTFASFVPNVVWIMLGGNDWDAETPSTPAPDLAQFTAKYASLVSTVRTKYPAAHVFVAIAPSLNDDYPVGYAALSNMRTALGNVVAGRVAAGDNKVYAYEFARATGADLTGCGYHANLGLHRKMADEAILQIKAKTGWL